MLQGSTGNRVICSAEGWPASALSHRAGVWQPLLALQASSALRPIRRPPRALPCRFTSSPVIDRLHFRWFGRSPLQPELMQQSHRRAPALGGLTPPVNMCDHPFSWRCSGYRQVLVPRPVSRPDRRRCSTVATTSLSSSGPTASWMAVIRPYSVIGRGDGLAAPDLLLPTDVTALRAITVAMSCPPVVSRHRSTRRGRAPCALGSRPGKTCDMVRSPAASACQSGRVLLTSGKIGCMR